MRTRRGQKTRSWTRKRRKRTRCCWRGRCLLTVSPTLSRCGPAVREARTGRPRLSHCERGRSVTTNGAAERTHYTDSRILLAARLAALASPLLTCAGRAPRRGRRLMGSSICAACAGRRRSAPASLERRSTHARLTGPRELPAQPRAALCGCKQALTPALANGAANARATRRSLPTLPQRRRERRRVRFALVAQAQHAPELAVCALQASQAWVEAFQPEFAALRSVRRCCCFSVACLRVAGVFAPHAASCDAACSRCGARLSTRKQARERCTRRCLRFATAPPGRRTALVRAVSVCAPTCRTRMQARLSQETVLTPENDSPR